MQCVLCSHALVNALVCLTATQFAEMTAVQAA